MKKSVIVLLSLLIVNLFLMGLASAQDDFEESKTNSGSLEINPETGLPYEVDIAKDVGEKISKSPQDFLKKELVDIEENKSFSWIYKISVLNPFFKIILGTEFSLSFLFILNFVLWFFFVVYIFRIAEIFAVVSTGLKLIVSLGAIILISWLGAVIIALVAACIFSENFKNLFKEVREKQKKTEEELNRERLRQNVKISEEFTRGISKGLE